MTIFRTRGLAGVLVLVPALGCAGPANDQAAAPPEPGGGAVVTLWTDALELFMEYPPQIAGVAGDAWAVHLTLLDGWQPVREGSLTLRLVGPSDTVTVEESEPARAGIFTPVPVAPSPGVYRAEMELLREGVTYAIPVGDVRVFGSEDELPQGEEEEPTIVFLKEQQWEIDFAVEEATIREVPTSVPATGVLTVPPDRSARISAPVPGLVKTGAAGTWPAPGERVSAGQVLAVLAPTDADGSYAELRGRVERLQREVERAERLYAAEAIPERRLIEARHARDLAVASLEALGGESGDGYAYTVRSPISGVLVERQLSPGERVEAGDLLFRVVDPRSLWLKLNVPASQASRAASASGAAFTVEGGDEVHATTRLVSIGDVLDPTTRTLPVILALDNSDRNLKVGMLAEARLFVGEAVRGTAVPAKAIQEEDGMQAVYVELGGESFERRIVRLGPSDGEWTIVRSGVEPGDRVVSVGAYQVRLASLGDAAEIGHGHPH